MFYDIFLKGSAVYTATPENDRTEVCLCTTGVVLIGHQVFPLKYHSQLVVIKTESFCDFPRN